MAENRLGDIPGAEFMGGQMDNASVASNGAGALVGYVFVAPANINVVNAWWTPTGADTTANTTNTASVKRMVGQRSSKARRVIRSKSRLMMPPVKSGAAISRRLPDIPATLLQLCQVKAIGLRLIKL